MLHTEGLTLNLIQWGLLSPTVIAHKTLIQKLWQDNLLWDEQLQQENIQGVFK